MKIITGLFMAWGNFLSLPCPVKKWDNDLKNYMLGFLPTVGMIIGVLWAGICVAMVWLGFPYLVHASGWVHGLLRRHDVQKTSKRKASYPQRSSLRGFRSGESGVHASGLLLMYLHRHKHRHRFYRPLYDTYNQQIYSRSQRIAEKTHGPQSICRRSRRR